MSAKKRVAIIGAGWSGLAGVKSCLEEGLEPVCFEQFDKLGGVWYYTDEYREGQGARAFEKLASNVSKDMLCYSDFPFPSDCPPFVSCQMVCDYMQSYCDKFGLNNYIHFNTKVRNIRKSRDYDVTGRWKVESEDKQGNTSEIFDFVMVCSGFYKKARYPAIDGMESFKGCIDHSQTFKSGQKYKDQTVLVVGNSHSAADMSAMISDFATQVYCAVGRGMYVIPKFGKMGQSWDSVVIRRANYWSLKKLNKVISDVADNRLDHKHSGFYTSKPPMQSRLTIGDDFPLSIMTGKVKIVGDLCRLGPEEAEFTDGNEIKNLDAILFATGYGISLDFIAENIVDEQGKLTLYKLMFPVHAQFPKNTLSMVGLVDSDGPIPPMAELQARLAARVFSGAHTLPSKQVMTDDVNRWNNFLFERYGRYKYLMPNMIFRDEIAAELGVTPSWWNLVTAGPRLAHLYYYGPAFPFCYRLWGPHAWSGARKAIDMALEHGNYAKQPRVVPRYGENPTSSLLKCVGVCAGGACLAFCLGRYYSEMYY